MRKFIAAIIVLSLTICMCGSVGASADDVAPGQTTFVDYLQYPEARSLDKPTKFFDLSNGSYSATFDILSQSWLYTNYYFYPNSNSKISVSYTVERVPRYSITVGCYDLTDSKWVATNTSNMGAAQPDDSGAPSGMFSGSYTFSNLKANHKYAIAWHLDTKDFTSGSAVVKH